MEIIQQGAEAVIELHGNAVIKKRREKSYRNPEIDGKIRKMRTRSEARLLERASGIVPVPKIMKCDEEKKEIRMEYVKGKKLSDCLDDCVFEVQEKISEKMAENVSALHNAGIIHGDLTTGNMILPEFQETDKIKIYFLDFGLGFMSRRFEDKAVDLHLLKQSLKTKHFRTGEKLFEKIKISYGEKANDSGKILQRLTAIEKRRRYGH